MSKRDAWALVEAVMDARDAEIRRLEMENARLRAEVDRVRVAAGEAIAQHERLVRRDPRRIVVELDGQHWRSA